MVCHHQGWQPSCGQESITWHVITINSNCWFFQLTIRHINLFLEKNNHPGYRAGNNFKRIGEPIDKRSTPCTMKE
ncbi:MAG: hypothetical protein DRH90_02855 [Deltaproteobacteria bacterium]|nr:MAG: hypothetical protein DRH90_02855 [Deltaproteobacteria bacterium]RLC17795.1 MAG: hypothetical protein DRI24_04775 [Deltaproteobacteria bacterium]